ncbi:MAG: leucine-rich repeat protein, partial [Ruminococcus callidus]|nr:leucine-rich repeat protein [Ruminococcus callidus]
VTLIGDFAFDNCISLKEITIPDSVTSIGRRTFCNTKWLENKQKENPLVIVNNVLIDGKACSGNIIIPNSVTSIVDEAFAHCESLKEIKIPDSVTSIGWDTFSYCKELEKITIPNSVTSIDYCAFNGCDNLKDVYYSGTEKEWNYIKIHKGCNSSLLNATIHFNSKPEITTKPTTTNQTTTTTTTLTQSLGDMNGDSKIDSKDAVLVLKSYAESLASGGNGSVTIEQGDVNKDGKVDSKDAVLILRYYAATLTGFTGTISEFNK